MKINPATLIKAKMPQNDFMYLFLVPLAPLTDPILGSITGVNPISIFDFALLARSVSIPEKSIENELIYTKDGRFNIPKRWSMDHSFSLKLMMTGNHTEYSGLISWYKSCQDNRTDAANVFKYYSDAYVVQLDMKYIPTWIYTLKNVYPLNVPSIGLDANGSDGIVELDCKFSCDDIDYGESGGANFIFQLIQSAGFITNIVGSTQAGVS